MKTPSGSVVLLALAAALGGCGTAERESAPTAAVADGPALVLRETQVPQWTPVGALVATVDEAQALARIPGILASLAVSEGDFVRKGQAIGRITDSQLGFQSGAYGAQAAAAEAQAVEARAALERIRYLYDNGVYAKSRLEQAQAAASAAEAQVRAARQQQQSVNALAGQGVVLAPATGRVLAADVPAGSAVAPGVSIATITSGPVVLRLDLPETLAGKVRSGSAVVASGLGAGDEQIRGTIIRVYPSVIAGQVRADADLPGLDARLIGRRVEARVETGRRTALLVPEHYLATRHGIDTVALRTADGQVAQVPVQTAPAAEQGLVEILSGVSAGDTLVAGPGQ